MVSINTLGYSLPCFCMEDCFTLWWIPSLSSCIWCPLRPTSRIGKFSYSSWSGPACNFTPLYRLGNLLSLAVYNIKDKTLLAIGASTSICAVIGFDIMCRVLQSSVIPLNWRRIGITLLSLLIISLVPGVDFWGHFGSLLGGFMLALGFFETESYIMSSKKRQAVRWGGRACIAVYSGILIWLGLGRW